MPIQMHDDEVQVDEELVRQLLASQVPHVAHLQLAVVEPWGTDHAIWRLGDELVVRIPRIHWAAGQAALEARWLPVLATLLPVEVPEAFADAWAQGAALTIEEAALLAHNELGKIED